MGTHCITTILFDNSDEKFRLYKQYDGSPERWGLDLAKFLAEFKIVNGVPVNSLKYTAPNMNCLALQIVAEFKVKVGDLYYFPQDGLEEYNYTISANNSGDMNNAINIECYEYEKLLFSGTAKEYINWVEESKIVKYEWDM